jgi:hypothetical protein
MAEWAEDLTLTGAREVPCPVSSSDRSCLVRYDMRDDIRASLASPAGQLDDSMPSGWLFLTIVPDHRVVIQKEGTD